MKTIEYRVSSGEKLSTIARRHNVTEETLSRFNGLSELSSLVAGQTLRIPKGTELTQRVRSQTPKTDRVRAGEKLPEFAQRHHVSEEALRQANGLDASSPVVIGMSLTIPDGLQKLEPTIAAESPPLANEVKTLLKIKEKKLNSKDKTEKIWEAFKTTYDKNANNSLIEYKAAIILLTRDSSTPQYYSSWVGQLLDQAAASNSGKGKDSPAFETLIKAVITEDASNCEAAYNKLADPQKRQLLDEENGNYEKALFKAAEESGLLDTDLKFMKQLVRIRFPHIKKIEPSTEADSPKWESRSLRRIYKLLKDLPAGHIIDNITSLYRAPFKQVGRTEEEDSRVGGSYRASDKSLYLRETPGEDKLKLNGSQNISLFDFSIRHELGHAVDVLLLEKHTQRLSKEEKEKLRDGLRQLKYYSMLPEASDPNWQWNHYLNWHQPIAGTKCIVEMIEEMMLNSSPPDNTPPASLTSAQLAKLIYYKINNDSPTYKAYLKEFAPKTGLTEKQLSTQVEGHRVYVALTSETDLGKPFEDGQNSLPNRTKFGDRVFVKSYPSEFASFSAQAFPRRIRNYRVRGPAEWFADTYALYHDPEGRKVLEKEEPSAARHLEMLLKMLQPK